MAIDHHLTKDEFFTRLSELLVSTHTASHGAVYLTQKPLPESTAQSHENGAILVRASNGLSLPNRKQKIKFSTIVQTSDAAAFYTRYGEICKKGMEGLRKRDRKAKGKKGKAKKRKEGKLPVTMGTG